MVWKEGCWLGYENDSKEGDYASNLLVSSKWLVEENGTGPASHNWSKKCDDARISKRQVLKRIFNLLGDDPETEMEGSCSQYRPYTAWGQSLPNVSSHVSSTYLQRNHRSRAQLRVLELPAVQKALLEPLPNTGRYC